MALLKDQLKEKTMFLTKVLYNIYRQSPVKSPDIKNIIVDLDYHGNGSRTVYIGLWNLCLGICFDKSDHPTSHLKR